VNVRLNRAWIIGLALSMAACAGPYPGPDKQFVGTVEGAALGAGAGAVTGFQVGAGTGPGALVGAGVGAVAGGVQGMVKDQTEEDIAGLSHRTREELERARAHEVLAEHYKRRVALHPTRDIYPADMFFYGDEVKLRPSAKALLTEIARLNKTRYPWSRFVITSYVKTADTEAKYAIHLAGERCRELGNRLIQAGLEARRIETRVVLMDEPVLVDPDDHPERYSQAIEFIPVDR
jgi:outer membrane protein OmpA-like peptidoglycan-associated protein